MERRLGLVVVNYASTHLLARTASDHPEVLVFVVDNFSSTAERGAIRRLCAERGWTLIEEPNRGFGAGVNVGAGAAFSSGCTDVLLLNPDACIGSEAIERLLEATSDGVTIASPRVLDGAGQTWFDGLDLYLDDGTIRGHRWRADHAKARRIEWLSGACLCIPLRAWELTGGFDESYFLYWEDIDFSYRARRAGVTLRIVPEAIAIHEEGGTQVQRRANASGAKSDLYYYFNIRNRLLFASLHLPPNVVARWSRAVARNAWRVLLHGGRRQFLQSMAPFRAAYRGVRDGRRIVRVAAAIPSPRRGAPAGAKGSRVGPADAVRAGQ